MFRGFLCLAVVILVVTRSIDSLECFSCSGVSDLETCLNISQCSSGQACFTNSTTSGQTTQFTLGCVENQQCGGLSNGAAGLVGRDISERSTQCHECCSTDRCNNQLCFHHKPTTCIDDVKVDCAYMNTIFKICQDIAHSKNICPKFCGLCTLVDGNWAEWSQWSECDVTCETGSQTRIMTCTNPAPANQGIDCVGNGTDTKPCTKQPCPVHGGWTEWSDWEACSVTCAIGIQRRQRNCFNPFPSRFGDHCFGVPLDDRICMPGPCANGGWTAWGSWTSCSASCGGGLHSHSRTCTNPRPSRLGQSCDGDSFQVELCNKHKCGQDVAFNAHYVTDTTQVAGQTMVFTTVLLNKGAAYNSSTGIFIVPANGTYTFSAQICTSVKHEMHFSIMADSTALVSTYGTKYNTYCECPSVQTVAVLNKNQKVFVQWQTFSSPNRVGVCTGRVFMNYFSG
ncbi:hemicentin-1-like [Mercenaria mercenaria]|uniref:hemicentin-1-like n=1 Tax=Mercenaria mercenaria TaxID=6596 RepID=UPI00234F8BD7|nr:hemicentin-1-like [Mercenaria mercenaria]